MFYEVIPTEVYRQGGGALTYRSDFNLQPGHIVLIPLGNRTTTGVVLHKIAKVDFPTKPITHLVYPTPIPSHLLKSALFLAEYYLSPLTLTTNLLIPAGLTARGVLKDVSPSKDTSVKKATPVEKIASVDKNNKKGKNAKIVKKSPAGQNTSVGNSPVSISSVDSLKLPLIPLNNPQKTALQSLQNAPGSTRLLRGVTGSGKTNIYLKMAADALKQQKSVILLVPEIALTSQLVKIFEQTFGNRVVLIHSNQTMGERRSTWLRLMKETTGTEETTPAVPLVIIGPRSALLAPVHNLGLIIIDESHENAYYQENPPRYSAIRLASFIAKTLKIPCILGSATPNITDYYLAKKCHTNVELSEKAKFTAREPEIQVVDLKNHENFLKNRYFSNQLLTKIKNNLQVKHQTLIFHNRRGSSPMTICENCGWQALCPECYLPLTLHTDTYELVCHICGHTAKVPSNCPNCHEVGIIHKGFGTKLLESELARLFPEAKIARFDGDNNKKDSLASLYEQVKSGQIDILIGTQTLARGLDLPHLATVGIVQADAGLTLPDFAAEERTFELLTQVIGRVGRGHLDDASVIVQTFQPDHPVIQTALKADFHTFADFVLKNRRRGNLPPFAYLARLSITYKTEKTTVAKIRQAYADLKQNSKLWLSPPQPAFHEHTGRGVTWQITLKSTSREALTSALAPYAARGNHSVIIDPPSLL